MNANEYLDDDQLALYALRLLPEAEAQALGRRIAGSPEERGRLARIELSLGAYAECAVDMLDVPQSSADRLMKSIAQDVRVLQMPMPMPAARPAPKAQPVIRSGDRRTAPALSWVGWAIAAALLVTSGWLAQQRSALRQEIARQGEAVKSQVAQADRLKHDREALEQTLRQQAQQVQEQAQQVQATRNEAATHQAEADQLRQQIAAETDRQQKENARTGQRTSELAAAAANAARERDALRRMVAAQAGQVAQLSTQAANARQVLDALNNPTALRVTLTVPKQKPSPTGRGTYVASNGTLLFTGSNLAPLPNNKVYELWLMPSDGSSPIPAGTFAPDASGSASVVSTQFRREIAAKGFAVTVENTGGSQTPTLPIVLAGL